MEESAAEKGEEELVVLDFDVLCATVALQTQGFTLGNSRDDEDEEEEGGDLGGVLRMWEGSILGDCLEDSGIALEATCCPCYRFGKNMRRANLGHCFIQGTIYFVIIISILFNYIVFLVTKRRCFLLMGIASTFSCGLYTGYFRTRIRKQFNIRGSGGSGSLSAFHDCMYHQICPCCTLCQESRTLEINNIQDGMWHGRGDTICLGSLGEGSNTFSSLCKPYSSPTKLPELCNMERALKGSEHSWNVDISHSKPLVSSV